MLSIFMALFYIFNWAFYIVNYILMGNVLRFIRLTLCQFNTLTKSSSFHNS